MQIFHLVSIATYIVYCYASPYEFSTSLNDITTGVGYRVEFMCRLNTTQETDNLHKYIVWSVNGVISQSANTNGIFVIGKNCYYPGIQIPITEYLKLVYSIYTEKY